MLCRDPAFPLLPDPRSISVTSSLTPLLLPRLIKPRRFLRLQLLAAKFPLGGACAARVVIVVTWSRLRARIWPARFWGAGAKEAVEQTFADIRDRAEGAQTHQSGRVHRIAHLVPFPVAYPLCLS